MRRVLAATGKVLITLGILVLLFVVYVLWGTGLYESQAQGDLQSQFSTDLRRNGTPTTTTRPTTSTTAPGATTTTTAPAPAPPVPFGDAVAHLVIPKIGLDKYVVQGVGVPDLRKGPGHYPNTPMPGQVGTAAIAGHRTTYGAPFWSLSDLVAGDKIEVTTLQGTYTYTVKKDPFPVDPHDLSVLDTVYPNNDPALDARGPAHAHDLQPAVLGVAASDRAGDARCEEEPTARARGRSSRRCPSPTSAAPTWRGGPPSRRPRRSSGA